MGWKKTLGTFGIVVYLLHEAFFVGILGSLMAAVYNKHVSLISGVTIFSIVILLHRKRNEEVKLDE